MKALVTGATGIVGANLVRELLESGWAVRALVRRGSINRGLAGLPVELATGDVLDPASLLDAVRGVRVVFHAAARFAYWGVPPAELQAVAVSGTRNVVDAAAAGGVERVVLTSSSIVFGSSTSPRTRDETADFTETDGYALSKVRQARTALERAREHGLDLVSVCPTLTVGAFDYALSTSNRMIVKYLNDPFRSTFAGGCNVVSARDVARGHLLAAEHGERYRAYILGGENLTWQELHSLISRLCATYGPLSSAGHTAAYLTAVWCEAAARIGGGAPALTREEAKMVGRYYWYDHARLGVLGYAPSPAREAVTEAVCWLLQTEHIHPAVRSSIRLFAPAGAA